ncbi:UNKNOWN [Stylonychia lemnae]|uniref:Uncharacterized protein n=1 Tax=Stylonychia lemnae TaxID=5949 RepID=A0A078A9E8_STYLE|nr:UNKNOWN [Stylonychia lemnae]|eukprot:CDW78222.1 UNKNOWN [Stylonychia lemnae]
MKLESIRDLELISYELVGKIVCVAYFKFLKQVSAPQTAHYCIVYFIHTQQEYRKQGHAAILTGIIVHCMREHFSLRAAKENHSLNDSRSLNYEVKNDGSQFELSTKVQPRQQEKPQKNDSLRNTVAPLKIAANQQHQCAIDFDDNALIAESSMSVITSKSKWGAINKHCTVDGCSTKKVINCSNWPSHVKSHATISMLKESVCFIACRSAECDICPLVTQTDTKYGKNIVLICSMCIEEKRTGIFVKGVSPYVSNVQRFTLGKWHAQETQRQQLNDSFQSYLEQNAYLDIDMQDETSPQQQYQQFYMPNVPFAKRQKVQDFSYEFNAWCLYHMHSHSIGNQ